MPVTLLVLFFLLWQKQHTEAVKAPPTSSVDIFEVQSLKEEEEEEEAVPPDNHRVSSTSSSPVGQQLLLLEADRTAWGG